MTYKEALIYGTDILKSADMNEASLDAWLLLEYRTGLSRSAYFLHDQDEMSPQQEQSYREDILKRSKRIPLQHITGIQEFMGLSFQVDEHVLIPRQDTECLVEEAMKYLHSDMDVLDMCTGSGCIIISMAVEARKRNLNNVGCNGVDISEEALKMSRINAQKLDAEVTFYHSDLFQNVSGKFDMIISNPPYIRTEIIKELQEEVKFHDPFIALDGKEDGLFFYQRIIKDSAAFLNTGGRLLFEIGYDQAADVSDLMKHAGFSKIAVKKDLAGLDRVVLGVYNC